MRKDEMRLIRDPIHGDVFLSYSDMKLLDTDPIQRLRQVAQLGTLQWVYPGATYSRFEHAVGVVHLAKCIARSVMDPEEYSDIRNILSAAAIFHDSGHPPFSHLFEDYGITSNHEQRSKELARTVVEDTEDLGFSGIEVSKVLDGKKEILSDIIAGTLDADRLDYLARDALHTGVSYGVIDSRIVTLLRSFDNRLCIDERAIVPAETVLFARYVMRALVYDHKVARCAGAMISKAVQYATGRDGVNKDTLSITDLQEMTDRDLMIELKKEKYRYSKDLVSMLEKRRVLKLAGIAMKQEINDLKLVLEMSQDELWQYENDLAERLGTKPFEVIIDKPNINRYFVQEAEIPVYREQKRRGTLMECSELANQINAQHERLWAIRFYAPERALGEARNHFKKVTGIELRRPTKSPVKCKIWH